MATQRSGTLVTYEEYCNLPDDERYEVIDGELTMAAAPSVLHQMVQDNIGLPLSTFVRANSLGRLFYSATDVLLSDTNIVQPDILFVSRERSHILTYNVINGPPDLIIEILSPSTAHRDTSQKRELYERFGVAEYWQVDTEGQRVVVLTLVGNDYEAASEYGMGETLASPLLPGFTLDINDIFDADVLALQETQD